MAARRKPGTAERSDTAAPARAVSLEALQEFVASEEELGVAARAAANTPATERVELLVFALGAEDYALHVSTLREIVRPPPLSEVPRVDPSVLGVTLLRGEVVPVYDPRGRLGIEGKATPSTSSRVIIATVAAGAIGLWVDQVRNVVRMPAAELEVPPIGVGGDPGAIAHLGRQGGRLFAVLNLAALVSAAPKGKA